MLPARHRMRRSTDFAACVRGGRRSGSRRLVVHLLLTGADDAPSAGLVVSKAVGGSVVRSRVQRRLRHVLVPVVPHLPAGARLVVRANPSAATATSAELDADLHRALRRVQPPAATA